MTEPTTSTSITFLGGTGTVTGSKFLVTTRRARVLVDCGLYQGEKQLRLRNREPLPIDLDAVDAVVCTHAHLDHTGFLPVLTRGGFRRRVHVTNDTQALAGIVLPDSGHLQEEEAAHANRHRSSRHAVALPLYTEDDARQSMQRFSGHVFDDVVDIADGVRATFRPAGHILGSAHVALDVDDDVRMVFSGDLGTARHPLLLPPEPRGDCDVLVVESTYGDRTHEAVDRLRERLGDAIVRTARRGGTVLIPAFAVDRTEVVLHELAGLLDAKAIPELPVFVDSPMALAALAVYRRAIARQHPDLRPTTPAAPELFSQLDLREVATVEASKRLNARRYPSIIVSASGMGTGGRVLHHLAHKLPNSDDTVILVGFQAGGTRGRRLLDGEGSVKMFGTYVRVRAEIVDATGLSSHADREELLAWSTKGIEPAGGIFVVHGEPTASAALRASLDRVVDVPVVVPSYGERVIV